MCMRVCVRNKYFGTTVRKHLQEQDWEGGDRLLKKDHPSLG